MTQEINFYPRPPRGGRRVPRGPLARLNVFLSTPSARRATARRFLSEQVDQISIHALREEGDHAGFIVHCHTFYFYPRPPRGGRLHIYMTPPSPMKISIHALREEGDVLIKRGETKVLKFLSTPSARRATRHFSPFRAVMVISIHALREEGDPVHFHCFPVAGDFYPRPPRGGRRGFPNSSRRGGYFYPRPPRGGRRFSFCRFSARLFYFYPRPPRGGRRAACSFSVRLILFLSTPSARRATMMFSSLVSSK